MNIDGLLPLIQALDPLFPIGSYTLSGGMETYTQKSVVRDKDTLRAYLSSQLYLLPYGDLGLAARAAEGENMTKLDSLCGAMKQPFEIRRGSEKLCSRFMKIIAGLGEAQPHSLERYPSLAQYRAAIAAKECDGHFPIAIGFFIRDLKADTASALTLFCYNILSASVNHAVKLIPLGQTDGQAALTEAMEKIPQAVGKALTIETDELGASGCGFDLRAMQHETLLGRLYNS